MKVIISKQRINDLVNGNVRRALVDVGESLVDSIRGSMWFGLGKKYKYKGKIHFASSPGMPPTILSGRLHDSITYATTFGDTSPIGNRAQSGDGVSKPMASIDEHILVIGSNVPYALALEKGIKTRGLAPRPYLWPSLKKGRDTIKKAFTIESKLGE